MRGEDVFTPGTTENIAGSPPHARGRLRMTAKVRFDDGITPACAGKTPLPSGRSASRPDHPRMRGEDTKRSSPGTLTPGSPPHARGRRREHLASVDAAGITPACAGKTLRPSIETPSSWDHPRMRGEDSRELRRRCRVRGSPPHARGRLFRSIFTADNVRITPACAGKTRTSC